ncbi:MAG: 3'-5' exonuclease [Planctomycetota bacterium]
MKKEEIIVQLHISTLRRLVRELEVWGVDLRSRRAMTEALLFTRKIAARDLLGVLGDEKEQRTGIPAPTARRTLVQTPARDGFPTFVAIDFETADPKRDSACAVGLVRVENSRIVREEEYFIRPPRRDFWFTYIHGITYSMVKDSPTFGELWPELAPWFRGAQFLAAHSAPFDQSVLRACCEQHGLNIPSVPFRCTVKVARERWGIYPTKLPDVCSRLRIALNHHEALSDARACARIMMRALREEPGRAEWS